MKQLQNNFTTTKQRRIMTLYEGVSKSNLLDFLKLEG